MILTPLALAFFTTRFGTARGSAPFPAWHPVRFAGRREGIQKSGKKKCVCVYVYVCMYVCVCVCVYVYVYVYDVCV